MATLIDTLVVRLTLDSQPFNAGMQNAFRLLGTLRQHLGTVNTQLQQVNVQGTQAFRSWNTSVNNITVSTLNLIGTLTVANRLLKEMYDAARRAELASIGAAVAGVNQRQYRAVGNLVNKETGADAREIQNFMTGIQIELAATQAGLQPPTQRLRVLNRLGIDPYNKDVTSDVVVRRFAQWASSQAKTDAEATAFGREIGLGREASVGLRRIGARGRFDEEVGEQRRALPNDDEVQRLTRFNQAWRDLWNTLSGLIEKVLTPLAAALTPVIEQFTAMLRALSENQTAVNVLAGLTAIFVVWSTLFSGRILARLFGVGSVSGTGPALGAGAAAGGIGGWLARVLGLRVLGPLGAILGGLSPSDTGRDEATGAQGDYFRNRLNRLRGSQAERGAALDLLERWESGGKNTASLLPGSTASGHWQINDPTWRDFAPRAGIDVATSPRAMSVSRDQQRRVADLILQERGLDPRTWDVLDPSRYPGRMEEIQGAMRRAREAARPPGTPGRLSALSLGPNANIRGVDEGLLGTLDAAAAAYIKANPGSQIAITSGVGDRATGTPNHPAGRAVDVQITNAQGIALANRGRASPEYVELARRAYHEARQRGVNDLGWGGAFATTPGGRTGDPMHFDRGGDRGSLYPDLQLKNLGPLSSNWSANARYAAEAVRATGSSSTTTNSYNVGDINVNAPYADPRQVAEAVRNRLNDEFTAYNSNSGLV